LIYEGVVYRPPSEAGSWILQATIGCSHNRCTFCNMYKDKSFRIRSVQELEDEIHKVRELYPDIRRVFIADGDALMIRTEDLKYLLSEIRASFHKLERIGIYASPKSIHSKTDDELISLYEAGLGIAYLGLESGDPEILLRVRKGDTREGIISAGKRLKASGIKLSITAISGLGGKERWREHALMTASAVNEIRPHYLGLLTLMVEQGTELWTSVQAGSFQLLTPDEAARETLSLLQELDCDGLVFRSNHASNYVALKGTLNMDRDKLISQLKRAIEDEGFKDESFRRL